MILLVLVCHCPCVSPTEEYAAEILNFLFSTQYERCTLCLFVLRYVIVFVRKLLKRLCVCARVPTVFVTPSIIFVFVFVFAFKYA